MQLVLVAAIMGNWLQEYRCTAQHQCFPFMPGIVHKKNPKEVERPSPFFKAPRRRLHSEAS
jgi:hypothetical protein